MTPHEIISTFGSILVIVSVLIGGMRIILREAKKNTTRLVNIEMRMDSCESQLTNHIPHVLEEVRQKLNDVEDRLIAHESKEEVYWQIVEERYKRE